MWTQEEAVFEGKYYQVRGAINQPKGVQKPHIPILVGGGGEKVTLKLVAQYGDACNVGGTIDVIKHKFEVIKQHCETVGRDYDSIHRTSSNACIMGASEEDALAQLKPIERRMLGDAARPAMVGTPETIRQQLAAYEEAGVQELILTFPNITQLESMRAFAREFIQK